MQCLFLAKATRAVHSPGRLGRDVLAGEFPGAGRVATTGAAAEMPCLHHPRWSQQHARSLELWRLGTRFLSSR